MENNMNTVAIVIDGKVEEIFECDSRLASLLLSNPIIIDVTNRKHLIDSKEILYDAKTDLFYKRVDLIGQEKPGIVTWPPSGSNIYNHKEAELLNSAIISNVASVQERMPVTEIGSGNKPCGCKG